MAAEPIKDLDKIKPIDHAVIARPHTAVYKMHRYFARRPWSVFRALIEHYSNPGSIILDPFCGGGVTVVEGLRLGRKVIGVDINPLATFITRMEVIDVDLDELQAAFDQVEAACREKIEQLYLTPDRRSGATIVTRWYEWSSCYECPECSEKVVCANAKKNGPGDYTCPHCSSRIITTDAERLAEEIIRMAIPSGEGKRGIVAPLDEDRKLALQIDRNFDGMVEKDDLTYPQDMMPVKFELRRPYNQHCNRFVDFYTRRNLYSIALLFHQISRIQDDTVRQLLLLNLSSLMLECSILAHIKSGTVVKPAAHYWISDLHAEANTWRMFESRFRRTLVLGKRYWRDERSDVVGFAGDWQDIEDSMDCLVLHQSSTSVPIPDSSVDVVITDPPYGGNVMYSEMSNFWYIWLRGELGFTEGLIDAAEEAVQTKAQHKGIVEYRDLIYRVLKEAYRVLKPHRWMVMTFHNREFKVWNAIHLAAHDAGFVLAEQDGMIYQPPIQAYTTTLYQSRGGAMLGDFILSFQKVDKPPEFKVIEHVELGRHIEMLAAEAVIYHNGATLSTIYMKLIPWLLNNNLLETIGEKEVVPYLQHNFEERDGKWRLKDDPDKTLRDELERYSQQHYKASYADAMQVVPVEARLEFLIRRLLYAKGHATQDEVLNAIYTNLINSNAADHGEIQRVLERIAQQVDPAEGLTQSAKKGTKKRKVWRLREDVARENLFKGARAAGELQTATKEESDHDLAIARLVELAGLRGVKAHIGKTEQAKYREFKELSSELPKRVAGMPKAARAIVEQIDVLWHNGGKGLVAAFEVERTTTIVSGIQRFRDLLAETPELDIDLYLVVPKKRGNEVRAKLGSPANRRDGLHKKIGYIYLEELQISAKDASGIEFEQIVRYLNGGK